MEDASATNEIHEKGLAVSKGIAYGEAFVMLSKDLDTPVYEIKDADKPKEIERFQNAILKTREDIKQLKDELSDSIGESEISIFDAHLMVLEDVAVMQDTLDMFNSQHYNIEFCYVSVIKKFISAFEKIDDAFIKERICDLKDVSRRVVDNMLGRSADKVGVLSDPLILVSQDFTPSDFALIDKSKILAIVAEKGSQTSHTAIISRSLGIPCVVGIEHVAEKISTGMSLLVDGYNGNIVINPAKDTLRQYTEIESVHKEAQQVFDTSLPFESRSVDGKKFEIEINISNPSEIPDGAMRYCDGVGLFRTENFFLAHGSFPSEEEQFAAYKAAALAANGKPVAIRTIDLGGDKNFTLLKTASNEENPFMGYRAVRFCLDHKDIFAAQIRAILRASAFGNVRILIPMISSVREVERVRMIVDEQKDFLGSRGVHFDPNIKVGAMIEVPSAAITADIISEVCDFISIGTNDLIQYLLAVDRVNEMVAHLYEPMHPAVMRTLNMVVTAGVKAGIPVCVCGEIASDPVFAPLLFGMGVTEFSMSPKSVSEIKFLLRKIDTNSARQLRDEILSMKRSRHIISRLRSFHYEVMQKYALR